MQSCVEGCMKHKIDMEVEATTLNNIRKHNEEDLQSQGCVSHWLQLVWETEVMPKDWVNFVFDNGFGSVHNQDSSHLMNKLKFEKLILRCSNNDVPMSWDLLDETSSHMVEEVVEDKDQGPSKELVIWMVSSSHQRTN